MNNVERVFREMYDVRTIAIEVVGDITRVRINDDDELTFSGVIDDFGRYEFHHASFDDRIIIRFDSGIDYKVYSR